MIFHNISLTFPFDNDSAPSDEAMLYNSFVIQKPACGCQQIPPRWMPQYSYGLNTPYGYLIWRTLQSRTPDNDLIFCQVTVQFYFYLHKHRLSLFSYSAKICAYYREKPCPCKHKSPKRSKITANRSKKVAKHQKI